MKTCKLIQLPLYHDDDSLSMDTNSLTLKGFPLAEEAIGQYLNTGYEVKSIIPVGDGIYVYMEKEE